MKHKKHQRPIDQLCDEGVAAKVKPGHLSSFFGFAAIIQAVVPKADPKKTVLIMPPNVRRAIIKGIKKGKGRK